MRHLTPQGTNAIFDTLTMWWQVPFQVELLLSVYSGLPGPHTALYSPRGQEPLPWTLGG